MATITTHSAVKHRLGLLYDELFAHAGYADLRIEIRILKRGQKEVIFHCGKQHRFVVPYAEPDEAGTSAPCLTDGGRS